MEVARLEPARPSHRRRHLRARRPALPLHLDSQEALSSWGVGGLSPPVRRYNVAVHTGCGKSLYDCPCDGECATTGKLVSATDDRDVQPLVEAARAAIKAPGFRSEYALRDALKPFGLQANEEKGVGDDSQDA